MVEPQYHLDGVVRAKAELMEDFDGPLDVILLLLSKNKIEIQDISISSILEQYLAYLEEMKRLDMEIASEFIAMASYLMLIKTKMLLSAAEQEEALSEMELLIRSLEERQRKDAFAQIKTSVVFLGQRNEIGINLFTKGQEPFDRDLTYRYQHDPSDLIRAMQNIAERSERALPPPSSNFSGIVGREPYPVTKKAAEVLRKLISHGVSKFLKLFRGNRSRSEIVATFLAVLELCRLRSVELDGDQGEDLSIRFVKLPDEDDFMEGGESFGANDLQRALVAVLFAAGEPVDAKRLALSLEEDEDTIHRELQSLMDQLSYHRSGIRIVRLENAYQMCSSGEMSAYVTKTLETRKPPKLSPSQLETLTIIAYYQPATKAYVEQLRGVDSAYSISALLTKKLIEESGRLNVPGRPILYRTTPDFLRTFGLNSLDELPEIELMNFQMKPDPSQSVTEEGAT